MSFLRESDHEYTQYSEQYQVYRLLSSIKRTSSGCEPIPILHGCTKHCAIELTPIVTHVFNLTLSCGHPPAAWKHSIVTPIPKVNPPQQLSDLRPISVTPILSRCFEKLFVKHHFFPALPCSLYYLQDQFAFRPTGSTTNALMHFFGNVTRLLEFNSYMSDVFLSISARPSIRFVCCHLLTLLLTLHTTARMLSFLRLSDQQYTQYSELNYRLLSPIKRTSSGCEPIPYCMGVQTLRHRPRAYSNSNSCI